MKPCTRPLPAHVGVLELGQPARFIALRAARRLNRFRDFPTGDQVAAE